MRIAAIRSRRVGVPGPVEPGNTRLELSVADRGPVRGARLCACPSGRKIQWVKEASGIGIERATIDA